MRGVYLFIIINMMRILVGFVVLDNTFRQSTFGLTSVVGEAIRFGTFSVVNYILLAIGIGFVFYKKVDGAKILVL